MTKLDVLLMHTDDVWIAQGLQVDIAAQGATIAAVREAFTLTVAAQLALAKHHGEEPLATFQPAPPVFWEKFSQAEAGALAQPLTTTPPHVPSAFTVPQVSECRVFA